MRLNKLPHFLPWDDENIITLSFDDGKDVESEIIGIFDVEDKEYIVVAPNDDSDDVYIYKYIEINDEEFELDDITDDEEFEKAAAEFDRLMEQEDEE